MRNSSSFVFESDFSRYKELNIQTNKPQKKITNYRLHYRCGTTFLLFYRQLKMPSTNIPSTTTQPAIINQLTSIRLQTLQSQLIDLSSDYWVLKGQFGGNPLVAAFAAPDWYDLDTRALHLRKSVHSRSVGGTALLQEEFAEFQALDTIRIQIGNQIIALRAQSNASGPVRTPILLPSRPQLPNRHSRSTLRRRAVTAAPVTSCSRQSTLRKRSTRFPRTRANKFATEDGNEEMAGSHERRAKRHRLQTNQAGSELRSSGQGSRTLARLLPAKFSSRNEPYIPKFPGLVNFPAPTLNSNPAILQSTGTIRKPVLAFCKLPRWRIAIDDSENMPWTTGVTTAQEIWERRFGGPSGFLSVGSSHGSTQRAVLDEVDHIRNSILEGRRTLAKAEKDSQDEAQEEAAEKAIDDSDSDYIP
jgi:hypothetical protein